MQVFCDIIKGFIAIGARHKHIFFWLKLLPRGKSGDQDDARITRTIMTGCFSKLVFSWSLNVQRSATRCKGFFNSLSAVDFGTGRESNCLPKHEHHFSLRSCWSPTTLFENNIHVEGLDTWFFPCVMPGLIKSGILLTQLNNLAARLEFLILIVFKRMSTILIELPINETREN